MSAASTLFPMLRRLRDSLAHRVNRRLVSTVGPSSRLLGRIEMRAPGATVEVGDHCRIEGRLVTGLASSQISIGDNVFVGRRTVIECFESIDIGDNAMISFECVISDTSGHSLDHEQRRRDVRHWQETDQWMMPGVETEPISIGADSWIGARVMILRGVSIGEGSVVGAGAVVTRDVPPWSVAAGNPVRVIRELPHPEDADGGAT